MTRSDEHELTFQYMRRYVDRELARWLAKNHGVLTVAEASRLGLSKEDLRALVERGRLHRRHKGVYVEAPPREGVRLTEAAAALAACGPGATLSHRTAAWLWDLLQSPPGRVELVLPIGARSRLTGVTVHRTRVPVMARSRNGLRLTDPVRTVLDVAATTPSLLTDVVDRALASRILRPGDLQAAAEPVRRGLGHGAARLRLHLLDRGYLGAPAPSVLESQVTRLIVEYGLPHPEAEFVAGENGEYRLDFAYPSIKLAIEVDGYAWHWDPDRVAADHARRNRLLAQGWRVLVYTWVQIRDRPDEVAAEIRDTHASLASAARR